MLVHAQVGFAALLELLAECTAARAAGGVGGHFLGGGSAVLRCKALLDAMANSKAARAVVEADGKPLFMTLSIADEL